ncbi:MAG: bacterioferritin [Acidimicrobiia bacterium]
MRGNDEVIKVLNDVLTGELTAINQYFIHAKMCDNWGFKKLGAFIRHESIDEMKHAEILIDRILFLEGVPNLQRMSPIKVGQSVEEQFAKDLELEYVAIKRLNDGIVTCVNAGDNGSRELLEDILVSEEEHTDWLETQRETIAQIGIQNYLSQQLSD